MEAIGWDYILKYVIVGESGVGKSSLLIRLTDDRFSTTEPTLGVEFGSRILTVGEDGERVKIQCWDTAGTESFRSITRSYFRGAAGALLVFDVTKRETFEHATSWLKDLREHADENVTIILVANKTDLCSDDTHRPATDKVSLDPPHDPILESTSTPSPGQASSEASSSKVAKSRSKPKPLTRDSPVASPRPSTSSRPRAVTAEQAERFAKENSLMYVETSAKEGWNVVDAFERTARQILQRYNEEELDRRKPKGVSLDASKSKAASCC